MSDEEREEDAIYRMLVYIRQEMIKNNLNDEVVLIEILIESTERTLKLRRINRNS